MSVFEGASARCSKCRVPTCAGSLILNQQVLLFVTSGLLQHALVAVVFAVRATNLQESQWGNDDDDDTNQSACLLWLHQFKFLKIFRRTQWILGVHFNYRQSKTIKRSSFYTIIVALDETFWQSLTKRRSVTTCSFVKKAAVFFFFF